MDEVLLDFVFVTGLLMGGVMLLSNRIVWRFFPHFRLLRDKTAEFEAHKLQLQNGEPISRLNDFPRDRSRILLVHYFYPRILDDLHDVSTVYTAVLMILGALTFVIFLILRSFGVVEYNLWFVLKAVVGGSEYLTFSFFVVGLFFRERDVRKLINSIG